jgi:RNA polymerase sigma-70 factor, ECF subfamily
MIDWEAIVRNDGPAVWRTAFRLLASSADADECYQEAFANAIELAGKASGQSIRSWRAMLVRLATARAVDRLRQRVRRTSREAGGQAVNVLLDARTDSRPLDRAQQSEMSERLRSALAHLPPKQADAFCLHCLEGWSYREVAEQMNESVDHVGVLVHRARADLRERIGFILSGAATGAAGSRINRIQSPPSTSTGEVSHEQ